ncbi:mechanosensitive ion channel family protein, partial [Sphingomonas parva]
AALWLLIRLAVAASCRLVKRAGRSRQFLRAVSTPAALLGAVLVGRTLGPLVGASIVARQGMSWLLEITGWAACGWVALRVVDGLGESALRRLSHKGRLNATSIVQFAVRIAKAALAVATFMAILDALGFDVTAAVAALGIGGIALALGAQKTVENLLASLSILSDRPFRIGETCRFGTLVGTVEEIGMRSSRIRTLDGTLLTIPNSILSNAEIENYTRRSKALFKPVFHVATASPPAEIERLLRAMRDALSGDPRIEGEAARVRLLTPTADRLPIEVFATIRTHDFDAFLAIQEELMLKLLRIVHAGSLRLAPPEIAVAPGAAAPAPIEDPADRGGAP